MINTRSRFPRSIIFAQYKRHGRLRVAIALGLMLVLSACGGGDTAAPPGPPVPATGSVTTTDVASFGASGAPAFRLVSNSSAFDLREGNAITIPVGIERVNGHSDEVTLSVVEPGAAADSRLGMSLTSNLLADGNLQTSLTASFAHDRMRAIEQQRTVRVSASDGITTAEFNLLLNIRPTELPDIYLLVGQSNMVGFSEDFAKQAGPGEIDEPNPDILQLNVTANDSFTFNAIEQFGNPDAQVAFPDFVVAEDPLHTSRDPSLAGKLGTRVGLGLTFAKQALADDPNHRIILVPAAWSATGFCDTGDFLSQSTNAPDFVAEGALGWNPFTQTDPVFGGTTLFNRAVLRANLAIQRSGGILRGILWHQGESDSENAVCSQSYAGNLATLASEFRTRIITDARGSAARGVSSDVPFIAGSMSRGIDERGNFNFFSDTKQQVDNVHRSAGVQGLIPAYGFVNFDDLVPSNGFPCGEGSCVHFGSDAYREMGVRYYAKLQDLLN